MEMGMFCFGFFELGLFYFWVFNDFFFNYICRFGEKEEAAEERSVGARCKGRRRQQQLWEASTISWYNCFFLFLIFWFSFDIYVMNCLCWWVNFIFFPIKNVKKCSFMMMLSSLLQCDFLEVWLSSGVLDHQGYVLLLLLPKWLFFLVCQICL